MRKLILIPAILLAAAATAAGAQNTFADTIIKLERGALDRWGKGDPKGYMEIYAPELTYFDPMQPSRVNGLDAIQTLYLAIRGKVSVSSYDMLEPRVQRHGDVAILTFNLRSHAKNAKGEPIVVPWNSTEVYVRTKGQWKIAHSHWSITQPAGIPKETP